MAEGFARFYGGDVMNVGSAGLSPAPIIQPLTFEVMQEKNVPLDGQFPKDLGAVGVQDFEILVNMSGWKLPTRIPIDLRDWKVDDPIGREPDKYREVRDQIEALVMRLILELRRDAKTRGSARSRVLAKLGRRDR